MPEQLQELLADIRINLDFLYSVRVREFLDTVPEMNDVLTLLKALNDCSALITRTKRAAIKSALREPAA